MYILKFMYILPLPLLKSKANAQDDHSSKVFALEPDV